MHTSGNNLLLINPWIYDFAAYDLWSQPLGLLYIASFLRQAGFRISYIDCLRSDNPAYEKKTSRYGHGTYRREIVTQPEILSLIPRRYARYGIAVDEFLAKLDQVPMPDAILITSLMTYWYPGPKHVVEIVRRKFPGKPVILGGVYASLLPDHAQQEIQPDYLIQGPGEEKVLRLLTDILTFNPDQHESYRDLDLRPYPAFDLVKNPRYLCLMTSRGCPFDCSFCGQKQIAMKYTQRRPEKVVREIKDQYRRFKVRDFAFYDDALFIKKDHHIKPILREIISSHLPLRFHTPNGLFAGEIDAELAELMYNANFKTIRLSFETSNEKRRKDMSNKISNLGMCEAIKNLVRAGYTANELDSYVIMGLPNQTLDEILKSMIFVNNLGVQIRLSSYSPIPGTLDFDRAVQSGLISEGIDPLLTNKTLFPLRSNELDYETFRKVRIFGELLNRGAQKDFAPFGESKISESIKRVIRDIL